MYLPIGYFTDECTITIDSKVSSKDSRCPEGIFQVMPYPYTDRLYIRFPASGSEKRIRIFDTVGQLVLEQATRPHQVEIDAIAFGTKKFLVIVITTNGGTDHHKVIVN